LNWFQKVISYMSLQEDRVPPDNKAGLSLELLARPVAQLFTSFASSHFTRENSIFWSGPIKAREG